MKKFDVTVIGAGIVGVATAREIKKRFAHLNVLIIDKENKPAVHQTGRNSGVIHAGVYYSPGSLKAAFCQQGLKDTVSFCQGHNIPYQQCGKLIVATNPLEQQRLQDLYARCQQNELQPVRLNQRQLQQKSPNTIGTEAIFIQQTGIVDYKVVTQSLLQEFKILGGESRFDFTLERVELDEQGISLFSGENQVDSNYVINCTGVMTDRVAEMFGLDLDFRVIPFKGEYYRLPSKYNKLIEHLIYPVPDPSLPFLGVHLTKMIDGSITVGPNAVLAGAREGYGKFDFSLKDTFSSLAYSGFWRLLKQHKKSVLEELQHSFFRSGYLSQVHKYCPQITIDELLPYPSGIRAQAVGLDGTLLHDFKFVSSSSSLHVCNAPSPAATSAMPIARNIVDQMMLKWDQ
jgi:L-2-hydroxyglutarate oxidase